MPQVFCDNANRKWSLAINTATIKRVKEMMGVNLLDVVGGKLMDKIASDPALFADILFVLVKPQADALGVSDVDFGESLAGDEIEAASLAFIQALVDFFPKGRREVLGKAIAAGLEKARKDEAALLATMAERLSGPTSGVSQA
jgi:hypothetical protein